MIELPRARWDRLLQSDEGRWCEFVCEALEEAHPHSPLFAHDEEDPARRVLDWTDRARANGMRTDDEVYGFIAVMHSAAPNFDQHPVLRARLDDGRLDPSARWESLFDVSDHGLDVAWREVEAPRYGSLRDWRVERCASAREAFVTSGDDPRFVALWETITRRWRR